MKNNNCNIIFSSLFIFAASLLVYSQDNSKEVPAYRIYSEIHVDGKLSEKVWLNKKPMSGFTQKDPIEGGKPNDKTYVYFLYDDENLYIGARMFRDKPEEIQAYVARRDNMGNSERIIISLDTFLDKRTSYTFALTSSGVRADYYHPTDSEGSRDYSFNPVWIGQSNIDSAGWSAEFKIPFSQLRFNDQDSLSFGVNANKWVPTDREDSYWVLVPRNQAGWSSRFGKLTGFKDIENSRGIELLPYIAGNALFDNSVAQEDPFSKTTSTNLRAGLDLKYGIGSNMTLDATLNPDFGQVEADPAIVNLSEFEIFFDEQRPFFLERKTLFSGYGSNYFYSRRIGASPNYTPYNVDYIDRPNFTRILGAAKLTGRTSEGLSVGALTSVTEATYAEVFFQRNDSIANMLIEPLATYNVIRLQQEFGKARNSIGIIATGVERNIDITEPIANDFNKRAYTGGVDYYLTFLNRTYELQGHFGGSYIHGNNQRMLDIQQSSTHFFQRPDASHVNLDSNLRSLSGYTGSLQFNKISGKHWLFDNTLWFESPGFELNDIGSLQRADGISYSARLRFRENRSTDFYHSYNYSVRINNEWNFEGIKLKTDYTLSHFITFAVRSTLNTYIQLVENQLSDTKTRGGPMMAEPWNIEYGTTYNSDWTRELRWNSAIHYKHGGMELEQLILNSGLAFNRGRIKLDASLSYRYENNPLQYLTTKNNGKKYTYGKRYIFAKLKRNELSLPIRFDYALTPDLTFELYAEPFISDGSFSNHGELIQPRSTNLAIYGKEHGEYELYANGDMIVKVDGEEFIINNYDFHYLSLRSNFVVRWEWIPGSTLFFVWQQNRAENRDFSYSISNQDFNDFFQIRGTNSVALKVSYWLPIN